MRAGLMRDRVTILTKTVSSDGMGGQSESWSEVATVAATVVTGSNRIVEAAGQAAPIVTQRVRMRYRSDVSDQDRLAWNGDLLDIIDVSPTDGRKREMIAVCSKRVGESYP